MDECGVMNIHFLFSVTLQDDNDDGGGLDVCVCVFGGWGLERSARVMAATTKGVVA